MNAFDEIIGYEEEKNELERICDILKNRTLYQNLGVMVPSGLLLHGEPGLGKTMMASALAKESGLPSFVCRKDLHKEQFIMEIRKTFDEAAKQAPSIVFLDDLDKYAVTEGHYSHNEEEFVVVQSCMDKYQKQDIFVLATANSTRNLPDSMLRPGRFDRVLEIDTPDQKNAAMIIRRYLQKINVAGDIDCDMLAKIMNSSSCATLESVINMAGLYAGYERSGKITLNHILYACLTVVCNEELPCIGMTGSSVMKQSRLAQTVALHEAGHAVVSEILTPGSVTLVYLCGKKEDISGQTRYWYDPINESFYADESRAISDLGGKAATELIIGQQDPGSVHDLHSAYSDVSDMVTDNGYFGIEYCHPDYRKLSNSTRFEREQIIQSKIKEYYHKAREILMANRGFLEKTAAELLDKGLLSMADIQRIKAECEIKEGREG